MKRYLSRKVLYVFGVLTCFAMATPVYTFSAHAQETATTSLETTNVISEPVTPISTTPSTLDERTRERIQNLAALMSNRMETVITRLQQISDRITSRSTLLRTQNKNTDTEQYIENATQALIKAEAILANIDTQVFAFVSSEEPRSAWEEVKISYQDASGQIQHAGLSLEQALDALKNPTVITIDYKFQVTIGERGQYVLVWADGFVIKAEEETKVIRSFIPQHGTSTESLIAEIAEKFNMTTEEVREITVFPEELTTTQL